MSSATATTWPYPPRWNTSMSSQDLVRLCRGVHGHRILRDQIRSRHPCRAVLPLTAGTGLDSINDGWRAKHTYTTPPARPCRHPARPAT